MVRLVEFIKKLKRWEFKVKCAVVASWLSYIIAILVEHPAVTLLSLITLCTAVTVDFVISEIGRRLFINAKHYLYWELKDEDRQAFNEYLNVVGWKELE